MDELRINDKFHVTSQTDVRDKDGQIVTRYQPGFTYDVTARNLHFVQEAQIGGVVFAGRTPGENDPGMQLNSARPTARGNVTTKE